MDEDGGAGGAFEGEVGRVDVGLSFEDVHGERAVGVPEVVFGQGLEEEGAFEAVEIAVVALLLVTITMEDGDFPILVGGIALRSFRMGREGELGRVDFVSQFEVAVELDVPDGGAVNSFFALENAP